MEKRFSDRKKMYISGIVFLLLLVINAVGIYLSADGAWDTRILRNLILSFYYVYYLGLGRWMNAGIVVLAAVVLFIGLKKGTVQWKQWGIYTIGGLSVSYLSIFFWLSYMGGLEKTSAELLLQLEFYVFVLYQMFGLGSYLRCCSLNVAGRLDQEAVKGEGGQSQGVDEKEKKLFCRLAWTGWIFLLASLIPMLAAARYIFPQSDDWSLGYKTHIAFQETGSFIAAFAAAVSRSIDAYVEHTGTYFSLLMMSLHPGAFRESWYVATPYFFVGVILLSAWFLFREICRKTLKLDRSIYLTLTAIYCLLVIQCMPTKASAFYWFNGAVNYILPHCLILCMLAFTLRLYRGERKWYNYLGAGLTAICAAGGNLVTVVGGLTIFIEIYFLLTVFKKWKDQKALLFPGFIFLLGFAANAVAPGNTRRVSNYARKGLLESFVEAFTLSLKYMLDEWMHWSLFLFLILVIPILWIIAGKIKASWRYPLLFPFLAWGSVAGMFFAPLYAMGRADSGRYFNIMYMTWVVWLMIIITYLFGWLRKKYRIQEIIKSYGRYYAVGFAVMVICGVPGIIADPEFYGASYATKTILSGEAQSYATVYGKNIEILQSSDEKEVTLYEIENAPLLFTNSNIEVWHSGIRSFYQKEKLNFIPWEGGN